MSIFIRFILVSFFGIVTLFLGINVLMGLSVMFGKDAVPFRLQNSVVMGCSILGMVVSGWATFYFKTSKGRK